ncbi:uncharacterized protein LOC129727139 isoform X1 [Wyeomyia smithii]|uniref:uncharacterized protein LOC129727139 isoform X1 n=1 Tax=Wyeomyia smithii TaxID=174621 RepID=UPI0024681114|nr:uncharacterized protein LOC129727139 isoform X1 [Wyeomyia smithii]
MNRNEISATSVFDTYQKQIIILKCLGLYPLVTNREKSLKPYYRLLNITGILIATMFYGVLLLNYSIGSEFIRFHMGSIIAMRMYDGFHLMRYGGGIALAWFILLSNHKIHRMLHRLQQVSEKILELDSRNRVTHFGLVETKAFFRITVVISLLVPLVGVTIVNMLLVAAGSTSMVGRMFVTKFLYSAAFIQLWLQPTLFLLVVQSRFRALNRIIRMYFPTNPTCSGFPSVHTETTVCSEKEQLTVIKQIKILHDKLNDVVELVNYCFSVQITFCVGLCFVIGVVCSFGLFRAFIYRNELFYMGVLNFIWYMYYLFFVLFFIAVGSKITREGKRIGVLVHKAINCSTSSAVINELNIFSQQLLHRSPVITCGLFVYDWTLLYTMIGATATYLIILIQFDVSFPNLVNVNNGTTSTGSAGT